MMFLFEHHRSIFLLFEMYILHKNKTIYLRIVKYIQLKSLMVTYRHLLKMTKKYKRGLQNEKRRIPFSDR